MQYTYQFEAPKYYSFTRKVIKSTSYELDIQNCYDRWFMEQHPEISPIKKIEVGRCQNQIKKNDYIEHKNPSKAIKRTIEVLEIKDDNIVKKSKLQQKIMHKELKNKYQPSKPKKCKSQLSYKSKSKKVRPPPCPFPIKIQREWQTKSSKSWYSLSQISLKKAQESMKKIQKKSKVIKINQPLRRFKF